MSQLSIPQIIILEELIRQQEDGNTLCIPASHVQAVFPAEDSKNVDFESAKKR